MPYVFVRHALPRMREVFPGEIDVLIIQHKAEHAHALKEVDAAAMAWAQTPQQVVEILKYVTAG